MSSGYYPLFTCYYINLTNPGGEVLNGTKKATLSLGGHGRAESSDLTHIVYRPKHWKNKRFHGLRDFSLTSQGKYFISLKLKNEQCSFNIDAKKNASMYLSTA